MISNLNEEAVIKLFEECLSDSIESGIKCQGIVHSVVFNSERLKEKEQDIYELLKELPQEFFLNSGGGYSFLMACNDKNGIQWTGSHKIMEKLFLLGMGIGKVRYLLPNELWAVLPGGVPYLVID